jgi:hypothetical protein
MCALAAFTAAGVAAPAGDAASRAPSMQAVSSRPDLVSAGEAVVQVVLPRGARERDLSVTVGGRKVTRAFRAVAPGVLEGLLVGLRVGPNKLRAVLHHGRAATLTLIDHPNGGPLFAGPQIQPWRCESGAVDAQCDKPPQYSYLYHSTDPSKPELAPYDPASPPSDVAMTTTDQGVSVPFIVRVENGYEDRDLYTILTLFDPSRPWTRWHPQPQWNHKLFAPGGGGCGADYHTSFAPLVDFAGTIPSLPAYTDSYVDALGRGFAVMSTALDNTGHACDDVPKQAESLIMAKAHVIENYGDIKYTIGTGCSGGSVVQGTVANAYPGAVYDGLIVTCSFPDVLTGGAQFADFHMLRHYFEDPSAWGPGVAWTPSQMAAVEGQDTPVDAIVADEALFKAAINPVGSCVPAKEAYNPQTNPGGVRCDVIDYMINVLGPRPRSAWSPFEVAAGHGFAGFPFSNVGMQYGLSALQAGLITPQQFIDLNAKIGGLDVNAQPTAARLAGDDGAIANAYRSGLVNEENNASGVAIIDHSGPDPGIAHDYAHAWWIRWRLDRSQGNHDNMVIWFGPTPLIGDPSWPAQALVAMDRWLGAVHADHSNKPLAKKIADDRPADVHDRCEYASGQPSSPADNLCLPPAAELRLSTPREVAGGSDLNDVLKCQLKPLTSADHGPLGLTDAEWAQLRAIFPTGVCDWSKPGVGQQRNIPWLTYQTPKGHVIYGGRAMPQPG